MNIKIFTRRWTLHEIYCEMIRVLHARNQYANLWQRSITRDCNVRILIGAQRAIHMSQSRISYAYCRIKVWCELAMLLREIVYPTYEWYSRTVFINFLFINCSFSIAKEWDSCDKEMFLRNRKIRYGMKQF